MRSRNGLNIICIFGMCFWTVLVHFAQLLIFRSPAPGEYQVLREEFPTWGKALRKITQTVTCIRAMLCKSHRGPGTEVFTQNNRNLQLDTERYIHFRSGINLSEPPTLPPHPQPPTQGKTVMVFQQGQLSQSLRHPNTLQHCCVCGWRLEKENCDITMF